MGLTTVFTNQWLFSFFFNFILISIFQGTPILTKKGWAHAGALGTILLGCLGWNGWLVVASYLVLGSAVTKIGYKEKKRKGIAESREGKRGPENVWGSAGTGALISILIKSGFGSDTILLVGFAASFGAKLADTFGSEIGKRWGKTTVLITTLQPVKQGTEGAVSFEGTLASLLGSIVMTIFMLKFAIINTGYFAIVVVISSMVATLLESFVGACLQDKFNWLTNELVNFFQTTFAALFAMLIVYLAG